MSHSRPTSTRRAFSAIFLILILVAFLSFTSSSEPNGLQQAWARAREAGSYRFTADVEQTLIPRASTTTIGQRDQRVDMRLDGEVTLPDYGVLRLRFEGAAGTLQEPLTIVQEAGQSYLLREGERVPLDNPAALAAPAADYLGYLAGAENVQQLPDAGDGLTRYSYDLNGYRFAEHVRRQWAAQRRSSDAQPLPPGVELEPSAVLKRTTGHGELWVGADGLPVRQVLDLDVAAASPSYDARMHVVVDLDFRPAGAAGLTRARAGGWVDRLRHALALPLHSDVRLYAVDVACLSLVTLLAAALVAWRRKRILRDVVLISMTALLLLTPVLQASGVVVFYDRQARALSVQDVLAESLGGTEAGTTPAAPQAQAVASPSPDAAATSSKPPSPGSRCGDGTPGVDSDGDGLLDVTEYCLGTDPFYFDTDRDMITDTLEANGFDYGGQHWPGNPFDEDCNHDGLADTLEWPEPAGTAASWDADGDNIPNLWDADNDNDGVPDGVDLSPYSHSALVSDFSLNLTGGSAGYEYIEVQLRPQDTDHLRYTTAKLDWPYDDKGQVQDLDNSPDDVVLIPLLEILSRRAPQTELATKYGVTVFSNGNNLQYPYRLIVPLAPVSDGGQIVAWQTKVAFEPSLSDIALDQGRIIWVVQAVVDYRAQVGLTRLPTPIQTYSEPSFQLTGLQVTRSDRFESAILGTPSSRQDDRQLFNLVFGLSGSFLNHDTPDLATIKARFETSATPLEDKWGVTANVVVDSTVYAHRDAAIAGTAQRVAQFLDGNGYHANDPFNSLVIAFEELAGDWNADEAGALEFSADLYLPTSRIHMNTTRGLKIGLYNGSGGWHELAVDEAVPAIQDRYADLSGVLATLQSTYPELTAGDLRGILYMFYTTWMVGQSRIIVIDAIILAPPTPADAALYDRYSRPGVDDLSAYLMDVARLGQPGAGLLVGVDPSQKWAYLREYGQEADETGFFDDLVWILGIDEWVSGSDVKTLMSEVIKGVKLILAVKTIVQCIKWANSAVGGWKGFMNPVARGAGGRLMGAIGCAIGIGVVWLQFVFTTDFSDPIALTSALVYAIVATVVAVVLFIVSLNPIGVILTTIFAMIDFIVFVVTWVVLGKGISIQEELIKLIAKWLYSADVLTWISAIDFGVLETVKPDQGLLAGTSFVISDQFTGKVQKGENATDVDVYNSRVQGWLDGGATNQAVWANDIGPSVCEVTADGKICRNSTSVVYTFPTARINCRLEVQSKVHAQSMYKESTLAGLVSWWKAMVIDLPAEETDPILLYLDILPSNIRALWEWADISNPDQDGDRLPKTQEQALGTNWAMWDSDCDGLSDKFEVDHGGDYGFGVLQADSDSDGLLDSAEYHIGTHAGQADSDGDGLLDPAEAYHQNHSLSSAANSCVDTPQDWQGGWWITLPGRADPVWVLSDPVQGDADGDGLSDASEKLNGSSPYAFDEAPRLTLDVQPLAISPLAQEGVWVESPATVVMTATLYNTGPQPISDQLTLCLPAFVGGLTGGVMTGARTPAPTPAPACNGLAWSFAGSNAVQRWEQVRTVVTGTVSSAASDRGDMVVRVPFTNYLGIVGELSDIVPITVDRENPSVTVISPLEGALLGQGTHSWVVGGVASDASSWVTRVDVDLPGAGTVTAEGTNTWAITWSIPADGVYAITARSYEYLKHTSTPSTVNLRVDNTAPAVALDLAPGAILHGTGGDQILVPLEGAATDNLSGLVRVQISLDGRPWREVWADAGTPLSLDWSFDWQLPNAESAQGYHTVALRAFDLAGNIGDPVERQVLVDVLPPTSELVRAMDPDNPPHVPTGTSLTIMGVANDAGNAPLPARPAELVGTLDSIISATIWLSPDAAKDNDEGVAVAWLGDVNGDRLADAAVGLPAATADGKVVIVYGRAGDWPVPPEREALSDSISTFLGQPMTRPAGQKLGYTVAAAGDVNGDGLADILLGDQAANAVYLIFGATGPLGREVVLDGPQPGGMSILHAPGANVGQWFGAAGDVNGDGFDDLLVGATTAGGGTAYLLLGQPNPWLDTVDLTIYGAARVDIGSDGARLTGVGDRDGDELDEFAVGDNSKVYVLPGKAYSPRSGEWLSLSAADVLSFNSADVRPQIAALGDVDGDGRPDFIYSNDANPRLVRGTGATEDIVKAPAASGFLAAPGDVDADGRADLLVGNAAGDAYVIVENLARTATVQGVAAGASCPYASGADLNSDGSSDLLLVPSASHASDAGMASAGFGPLPALAENELPLAVASSGPAGELAPLRAMDGSGEPAPEAAATALTLYVDDDYCPGCPNDGHDLGTTAFYGIADALAAASAGDTISVMPGVYGAFTVDKDNLTISGVHADAVFVDGAGGAFAAQVQNAYGVTLEKLTLRNAETAIYLDRAGLGGSGVPARRTTLRWLLVYGVTAHDLDMDPASTVSLDRATLASDFSAARINVRAPADTVLPLGQLAASNQPQLGTGNGLTLHTVDGVDYLFAVRSDHQQLWRYPLAGGAWQPVDMSPYYACVDDCLVSSGGELYGMFIQVIPGSPVVHILHFYRWDVEVGWVELASPDDLGGPLPPPHFPGPLLWDSRLAAAGGYVWWMTDSWWPELYRYDPATDNWALWQARLTGLDFMDEGRSMVGVGSTLYIQARLQAGGDSGTPDAQRHMFAYDTVAKTLTKLAPIPAGTPGLMPIIWDGDHYIYGAPAGSNQPLLRYDTSLGADPSAWQNLGTISANIGWGAHLARYGSTFYLAIGGDSTTIYTFPPQSLVLNRAAFVADPTLATAAWLAQDSAISSAGFGVTVNDCAWAAGSLTAWSPAPPAAPLTWEQAGFLDGDRDVYRVGSGSALVGGYHVYRAPATVSTPGGGGEFTQIQDAANSGANLVLVGPGTYPQPFYLLSGVAVIGSGADLTSLTRPLGDVRQALVSAEGVVGARLAGMTLVGSGYVYGVQAEYGTRWTQVSRCVIRGTNTGILVFGAGTELEVVNNTIVSNVAGMMVDGSPLDVRNTIFAYNTYYGINFSNAVSPIRHQYNDYWINGSNLEPNLPDASERLLDPLFVNPGLDNYRLLDTSPMVDAGNPTDPVPPGAGNRVDIGYHELGRAAFYVDDDYCPLCLNDGLTWGEDAFATIGDAMARVRQLQTALPGAVPDGGYSVGVNPGAYVEEVTVPSYVRLIGHSAQDTSISASGIGDAVTFNGVVQAEVRGFTLAGYMFGGAGVHVTGGSNQITITRNLLTYTYHGVLVDGRASADILFNTIVGNFVDGVLTSGAGSWARVRNNILASDDVGLRTASSGIIYNDYNLLWSNASGNYVDGAGTGLVKGPHDLLANPQLGASSTIPASSPAVDHADPNEDVPLGGGLRADIGYFEVLVAPVTILPGQVDVSTASATSGVHEMQVGIVPVADATQPCTDTLPTSWVTLPDLSGETEDDWQTAYTPALSSLYRVYSRATDVAGNQESNELDWCEGAFVGDDAAPVVETLQPADGYSGPAPLELRGQASDYDALGNFSLDKVSFRVNAVDYPAQWVAAPWQPEAGSALPRPFRAWVTLPNGSYSVQAWATDQAGRTGWSAARTIDITSQAPADTTAPNLALTSPATGWVTRVVSFAGTAGDAGSGLASVEVSVDGGVLWMPATVSGGSWSFTWDSHAGGSLISYPVRVRARDRAGNTTVQALVITIDAQCPSGPEVVLFSRQPGYHWDSDFALFYTLEPPWDNNGSAQALQTYDQITNTVPSGPITVTPDESRRLNSAGLGDWYLHLGASDAAGNLCYSNYGPWHVGWRSGIPYGCPTWRQTIILDGFVDTANNEWNVTSELLDDDERSGRTQSLYYTMDGLGLYLAWQGAVWASDGTLWAYFSISGAGTTTPVSDTVAALPFAADYAIEVNSAADGRLWHYNGGWAPGALQFAQAGGDTEIFVPIALVYNQPLKLLAFALDDAGAVWSVFPTTNGLGGLWSQSYSWPGACVVEPNAGQPRGVGVTMAERSVQPATVPLGPAQFVTYTIALRNLEGELVSGLQLALTATGGLSYFGAPIGATCADCGLSDRWVLNVPDMAAGATQWITVTGRLGSAAVLAPLYSVTTTCDLRWNSVAQEHTVLSHRVDGSGPAINIFARPGAVAAADTYTLYGTADDGLGAGVDNVQVRLGAGSWQPADGTILWSADLALPGSGSVQFQAQGWDSLGTAGPLATVDLFVDTTPPTVTLSLPATLDGSTVVILGTTRDPAPPGARVSTVEVQVDSDTAPWLMATGPYPPDAGGLQGWSWTWTLPYQDSAVHTVRLRATDGVGNVSTTGWLELIGEADLQVSKAMAPQAVGPYGVLTYTLTYTNAGPSMSPGISITDTLPAGVSYEAQVSAPPGWSAPLLSGNQVLWSIPLLPRDALGSIVFTARVSDPSAAGADWALVNTASIGGAFETDPANNTATVAGVLQGLRVSKRHSPETPGARDRFTYYIDITNTASSPATNLVITDILPAGVDPKSVRPSPGGVFDKKSKVVWTIARLGAGLSTQVSIGARTYPGAEGNCYTNWVSVDSQQSAPPVGATDRLCISSSLPATPVPTPIVTPLPTATPPAGTVLVLQGGVQGDNPDTYVYRSKPDANYALESRIKVGYLRTYAGLLRIDVSPIPADASILEAWLEVYATGWSGPRVEIRVGAYAISATVRLDEATWNNARSGQPWAQPGCENTVLDRRALPEAVVTTSGIQRWYRFNLTALVQDWLDGAMPNNGVLLRQQTTSPYSFQYAGSEYSQEDLRPRLWVRYR
jgi:uncharacterized repeat protein (TIGR01451 family)